MDKQIAVKARRVYWNADREDDRGDIIVVADDTIKGILNSRDVSDDYLKNTFQSVIDYSTKFIIPGLIDCHCHLVLPGDGTDGEAFVSELDDSALAIVALRNAHKALHAGVTTLRDLGSRNDVVLSTRKAIERNIATGPRIVASGVPLTMTGGHMHYLNGEVDGEAEVRWKARSLLKNGADLIKIVANGGGTRNTYPWIPSLTSDEIRAAIEESHRFEKYATAHLSCAAATRLCLSHGIDAIEHCDFWQNPRDYVFEPELADLIAERQVVVGKTLPAVYRTLEHKATYVDRMSPDELAFYDFQKRILENSQQTFGELHRRGVPLVASTDAGWAVNPFGDYATDLELMVDSGMNTREALAAGTVRAAGALRLEEIGTLEAGKQADFVVLESDPLLDISAIRQPVEVYRSGIAVGLQGPAGSG